MIKSVAAIFGGLMSASAATNAVEYKWPDTAPVDKSDPHWEFNNNLNVNGTQYHKKEVAPGKWQWVVDKEAMKRMAERERHRRDLYWALRSRVLTEAEMAEVAQYGGDLNIESGVPYRSEDRPCSSEWRGLKTRPRLAAALVE